MRVEGVLLRQSQKMRKKIAPPPRGKKPEENTLEIRNARKLNRTNIF